MQILLDLLQYLRKQRVDELKEVRRYSAHFSGSLAINLDLVVFNVLFFLKKLSFGAQLISSQFLLLISYWNKSLYDKTICVNIHIDDFFFFPFQIQKDMQFVKEDINVVERERINSCRTRNRSLPEVHMSTDDFTMVRSWSSSVEKNTSTSISSPQNSRGRMSTWNFLSKNVAGKTQAVKLGPHKKDNMNISNPQHTSSSGLSVVRKKRVHSQVYSKECC